MPGAPQITLDKAATADAMSEIGYSASQVGAAVGLHPRSVFDVLHRVGHWGKDAESSVFKRLRSEQTKALEAAGRVLAAQAMVQCAETLPKANAYQACLISSIMIDKSRLLAGESTQNIEVHTTVELSGLDSLAEALSRRITAPIDDAIVLPGIEQSGQVSSK